MGTVLEAMEYAAGPVLGTGGGAAVECLGGLGAGWDALTALSHQPLLRPYGWLHAQQRIGPGDEGHSYGWLLDFG